MTNTPNSTRNALLKLILVVVAALALLWSISPHRSRESSLPADSPSFEETAAPLASPAALPAAPPAAALPEQPPTPVPLDENADKIRVSELMVKNRATLPDEDGDFPDWIELENVSDSTVDLSGWQMRDSELKPCWVFPETKLAPGERLLLLLSGKELPGHVSFSLSPGETLQIFTANGAPVQELLCPDGPADRSWLPDGQGGWTACLYPTPGLPNMPESYDALMEQRADEGPLVINEVCAFSRDPRWSGWVGSCDWIELKNISDEPVELSDYYLSDDADQRLLYQLPVGTLYPGGLFLLKCSVEYSPEGSAPLCQAFSLDSTADRVYLSRGDGSLTDYVALRDVPYSVSFGRLPGENGWFFLSEPSPGRENESGARRVSDSPRTLTPDGIYDDVEEILVVLEGKGEIRYTTDGSCPSLDSPLYEEPIPVSETCLVRAICVEEGALPSPMLTLSYFINEHHVLPVASLVSNDGRLYNVYYDHIKDVELPCNLAFYEEGGGFNVPCGVKMHGETSLLLAKKNMSVRFRGVYGLEELHYDVFQDGGICDFTNLLFRGGQDFYHAIVRNELCTELARSVTDRVIVSRNRYCILYMDGRYLGIYALGEKLNEAMYAHQMGLSKERVVVETSPLGSNHLMYQEVFSYAMSHDLSRSENYRELCTRLDVDSLIDWILLEGCFANNDLTFGNVRYCRALEGDCRWRLMFYDLDSTFSIPENVFNNLLSPWALETRQVSQLINLLLQNPDFRASLLSRASELIPMLSNDRIIAQLDLLCNIIDGEVERDYTHKDMYKSSWLWNANWIRDLIREQDWNTLCVRNLCSNLNVTDEERAQYFPGYKGI